MEAAVETRADGLDTAGTGVSAPRAARLRVSVIIPARNEEDSIGGVVEQVQAGGVEEVIVVDGASSDRTRERALAAGARVIESPPGRGIQQNLGAAEAGGDVLLFLHADTCLPRGFLEQLESILTRDDVCAGAFRLAIDAPGPTIRWVENMANWRSRYFQLPYGDQAIFVRRRAFREAGGFAAIAVMEDFDLMRRLRKLGRIALADSAATTSARRWERLGVWRTTWINQLCIVAYLCGVSPHRIASWRDGRRRQEL